METPRAIVEWPRGLKERPIIRALGETEEQSAEIDRLLKERLVDDKSGDR